MPSVAPPDHRLSSRPVVLLLAGLPGVGKTTLARHLQPLLGAVVLNRDQIRDGIFPAGHLDYSAQQNEVATRTLLAVLDYLLGRSRPPVTIIDGKPFARRREIDAVAEIAEQHAASLLVLHCIAPEALVAARLRQDLANRQLARAQRDPAKAERIRASFEPISRTHLTIEMVGDPQAIAARSLAAITAHFAAAC